jgi:hypothetical protein
MPHYQLDRIQDILQLMMQIVQRPALLLQFQCLRTKLIFHKGVSIAVIHKDAAPFISA